MRQIGMRYGLICGLVYVAISLLSYVLGWTEKQSIATGALSWALGFGITFYLTYMAVKQYRDEANGGALAMGEAIKMALLVGLIAGVIAGLYTILQSNVIDPDFAERQLEMNREQWERQNMDDAQMEQAEKFTKMFMSPALLIPFMIIWVSLGALLKGVISGAMLKKDPAPIV